MPVLPSITQLLLSEFRFPDPALAGRVGVVVGYAVRHQGGILLFDTGFGFGNAELEAAYHPVARPIGAVLVAPGIRVVATPGHTPGHQSLVVGGPDGPIVLAGQASYTVGEWIGDPEALEGRSGAPDKAAYDRSIERLRGLDPAQVLFGHDRERWTA